VDRLKGGDTAPPPPRGRVSASLLVSDLPVIAPRDGIDERARASGSRNAGLSGCDSGALNDGGHDQRGRNMALMLIGFEVDDYDEWKALFDSDPAGRKAVAKGHRISRSVDNPNEIFLSVEYASAEDARTVLARLQEAGVLQRFQLRLGPAITEIAEETTYLHQAAPA
jgi:hypothetical protein